MTAPSDKTIKNYEFNFVKISKIIESEMGKKLIKSNFRLHMFQELNLKEIILIQKKFDYTSSLLKSFRTQLLRDISITNFYKLKYKDIMKKYDSGISILDVSKQCKVSPISLLHFILKKKYGNKPFNSNKLTEYDKKQLKLADKYDIINPLDQKTILEHSLKYEELVSHVLDKKNIKYKTQEDLIMEQKEKYGHAVATPDFLLLAPIKINGKTINWIEVKNFFGANTKFIRKKIKKQVGKYYKRYGPGCLVFRHGIVDSLHFDGTYIISF